MNARAKRRHGTGTVSFHASITTWRIRLPGQHGQQFAGFTSRDSAERALEAAAHGIAVARKRYRRTVPRILLRATLRYAVELAERNGMDVEDELRATGYRTKREGGP